MPKLAELLAERQQVLDDADSMIAEVGDDGVDEEVREKLRGLDKKYEDLATEIKTAQEDSEREEKFRSRKADADREQEEGMRSKGAPTDLYQPGQPGEDAVAMTPGELYVRSEAYSEWMKRFPDGAPSKGQFQGDSVEVGEYRGILGMADPTERLRGRLTPGKFRALVTSDQASAGTLVRPDYRGLLEPGLMRPLTVRALVTVIPVTTDAIEYVREATRASNAAPVAEASQIAHTGDETATKPEGGLTFALVTDTIKTIAEWVPATKRILSDAPALRAYIDSYLTDDLSIELEDQMVSGTGGEGFTGILNTSGIQTAGPVPAGQNLADVIRVAKRMVRTGARTNATAVMLNPEDAEAVDLLKTTTNAYIGTGPINYAQPGTLWGLPVVESEAVPVGTALVGDFRRAVMFDRESTTISVGTAGDDFIRNLVRVLAEMRAGFGVLRPAAFVAVDLSAAP